MLNISRGKILIYFFVFSILFASIVPVFESPDEPGHLIYINFVAKRAELPNQYNLRKYVYWEGHQPPFYYILGAVINNIVRSDKTVSITMIPNKKHIWNGGAVQDVPYFMHLSDSIFKSKNDKYNFYLLRIFSVFLGLLNIYFIFKLSRIFIKEPEWEFFPALFVASLPQFLFISGMINNDNLCNLFATISIYYSFRILESPERMKDFIFLGLSLGLGLLTKNTILFLVPVIILILFYLSFKDTTLIRKIGKSSLLLLLIVIAVSGWLYVRNYMLYGELFGTQMEKTTQSFMVDEKSLLNPYFPRIFLPYFYKSFIGMFGWMNINLQGEIYFFYLLLFILAIPGIFFYLKDKHFRDAKVGFSLIFVFLSISAVIFYNLTYNAPQGRYLFPSLSLISILFTLGLKSIVSRINSDFVKRLMVKGIIFVFILVDIVSILEIHNFYYRTEQYLQ